MLVRGIILDLPGSSIKEKVWLLIGESARRVAEVLEAVIRRRLLLAMVLYGSNLITFSKFLRDLLAS